jgi:drug/metabolite transporter (DMT)-like permease
VVSLLLTQTTRPPNRRLPLDTERVTTVELPSLVFGVLFILAGAFLWLVGAAEYRAQRRLPAWMLPISRLWKERYDTLVTRLVAAGLAAFGVLLVAGAFFA